MRNLTKKRLIVTVATLLVFSGCAGGEQTARQAEEETPAAESAMTEEPGAGVAEETVPAEAPGEAGEVGAGEAVEATPEAPGVRRPALRNWVLIEFARAIEPADLEWLEENGFRVDTVMGETMVRGWLEVPAGGEVIAQDPRIARIHAQMR
ncbi:MAG: hypothetical protein AMS25_01860 [Gemmatimonas sp. SM23_52]|nr:MAG: hypothetical protein AMS25_01860 [Gemmatimonas sp. SM23_52]